jgi:hypothetical protein
VNPLSDGDTDEDYEHPGDFSLMDDNYAPQQTTQIQETPIARPPPAILMPLKSQARTQLMISPTVEIPLIKTYGGPKLNIDSVYFEKPQTLIERAKRQYEI